MDPSSNIPERNEQLLDEGQQLDRRVPFAFYVAGQIVLGLGDAILDCPIVSGAVILGQALAFGVELNAMARDIPIEAQSSFVLHSAAFGISGGVGMIGEAGYRLIKTIVRIEKAWRNEQLSDNPTVGDIRDTVNPETK